MRRSVLLYGIRPRVAVVVLAVVTVLPAACGGGEASEQEGNPPSRAKLGGETTLKGLSGEIKVQVLGVEDPIKLPSPKGAVQEKPRRGWRFVGVRVRFTTPARSPTRTRH